MDNLAATGISVSKINHNNFSHIEELAQQGDITAKFGNRNYELNFKRMAQEYIETEDPKIVLDRKHKTAEELEAIERQNEELKQKAGEDEVILNNHVYKLTPMEVEIRNRRMREAGIEARADADRDKKKEEDGKKLNKTKASIHFSMSKSKRTALKRQASGSSADKVGAAPFARLPAAVELKPVIEEQEHDNVSIGKGYKEELQEQKFENQ